MNNNHGSRERMQQQSMGRGNRMRGMFSGLKEKPKDMKTSLKRLFSYVALHKKIFFILLIVVLFNTGFTVYSNVLVKDVINSISNNDKYAFTVALILLAAAYILHVVLQYLSSILSAHLSIKTVKKLRNDLFEKIVTVASFKETLTHAPVMFNLKTHWSGEPRENHLPPL